MGYTIDLLRNSLDEIEKFSQYTQQWVIETEKRRLKEDVARIRKTMGYIDHCWIKHQEEIVGVVRIRNFTFYSLGISPAVPEDQIIHILEKIIQDIAVWRPAEIEASLHNRFLPYMKQLGFHVQFSREQMRLALEDAKNLFVINDVKHKKLNWKNFDKYVDLFVDAYKGGIDEQIGLFSEANAEHVLKTIKNGEFGEVQKDLSFFIEENKQLNGGLITTFFENELFVVIVGIRRNSQHKGYGRSLMSMLIESARKSKKSHTVSLWVTTENYAAKRLYSSLGFETTMKINSLRKTIDYDDFSS